MSTHQETIDGIMDCYTYNNFALGRKTLKQFNANSKGKPGHTN